MRRTSLWKTAAACAVALGAMGVMAADKPPAVTLADLNLPPAKDVTPTGVYKVFNLAMEQGKDKVDFRLIARDGKIVQSYIARDLFAAQHEGLKLEGNKLTGVYVNGSGERWRYAYTLDLTVATDSKVTGTYTSKYVYGPDPKRYGQDGPAGAITGQVLTEAQLAKAEAIDPKLTWPQHSGPTGNWTATPIATPILDDLNQARLVWRSEQLIGHGPGTATRRVNQGRNGTCYTTCGGPASPIVYDGKVYQYYFEPPVGYDNPDRMKDDPQTGFGPKFSEMEQYFGKFWAEKEKRHWAIPADDHVLCIDAATGKTLWHTVMPFHGVNFTDHKGSPTGNTPAAFDGKIFVEGTGHFAYGVDAKTGKVLWENADYAAKPWEVWSAKGLMTSDLDILTRAMRKDPDVTKFERESKTNPPERNMAKMWTEDGANFQAVAGLFIGTDFNGSWVALDPATGKTVWKQELGISAAPPVRLTVEGQELMFFPSTGKGVDARTGKEVWNVQAQNAGLAVCDGDRILTSGGTSCTLYKVGKDKVEKLWSFTNGKDGYAVSFLTGDYVYSLSNQGPLVVLNAKDGSELWRGSSPGANAPGFSRVNDRVFLHPDSAHNCGTPQIMFSIAGKDTKQMCVWSPPINPTNPYNRPPPGFWASVVADGRIFVRGADGIYCFDIRKK